MKWSDGLDHSRTRREAAPLNDGLAEWRERARKVRANWSRDADAEALRTAYRDGLKAAGELVEGKGAERELAIMVRRLAECVEGPP